MPSKLKPWYASVDVDSASYALFAANANGLRRKKISTFNTRAEAEKQVAKMAREGETRVLVIERGARAQRSLGSFKTKTEAKNAFADALVARKKGTTVTDTSIKTVDDLMSSYLGDRRARRIGKKTLEEYEGLVRNYIRPHLGSMLLAKLQRPQVASWSAMLLERGGQRGRALGPKTLKHAFSLLSGALRWAVEDAEILGRNVCSGFEQVPVKRSKAKAQSQEDVRKLLLAARAADSRWEQFVTIAFLFGQRRGELLALNWADVDLEAGRVAINKTMSQTKGGVAVSPFTKTDRACTKKLNDRMTAAFRAQLALQAVDRERLGSAYIAHPDSPVFTDEMGLRLTPKADTNAFARLAKKAGVKTTSLHSTRHTVATVAINSGADILTVSRIFNQSNPSTTLNIYSHLMPGAVEDANDSLSDWLERALSPTEAKPAT